MGHNPAPIPSSHCIPQEVSHELSELASDMTEGDAHVSCLQSIAAYGLGLAVAYAA